MRRPTGSTLAVWLLAGCAAAERPQVTPEAGTQNSWIANGAIYEVFVRDFSPAGNFQGVIDGLDRIQAAGANVVWLMPIHPVGEVNRKGPLGSSYSVADYRAVNPEYGTEADFRRLVAAVHERGMKLILDWVANHTAWDHVWVKKHPDRYTRTKSGHMTVALNNDGTPTDWTDVADLDYSKPDTRRAMISDMRYWLDEFGIDGFRVDVAWGVPDDFWQEAVPQLRAGRSILLLAEAGEHKYHAFGFDLTYGWEGYHKLKAVWRGDSAATFVRRELEDRDTMRTAVQRLRFTTNHDETAWDSPPVELFDGSAGARAAFVAMALLPGVPLIYNGQEVESPQKLGLFVKEPVAWDQPGSRGARQFYRQVIDLARNHQSFANGSFEVVATDAAADVIAYRRGGAVVLVNARPRLVRLTTPNLSLQGARELLTGNTQKSDTVALEPHGFAVLELARRAR